MMSKQETNTAFSRVSSLLSLTRFNGASKEFWRLYVRQFAVLCEAEQAMLVGQSAEKWVVVHTWILPEKTWPFDTQLADLSALALSEGVVQQGNILAVRLDVGPQENPPVLLMELKPGITKPDDPALYFAAGIPSTFQVMRQFTKARSDVIFFAEILKLLGHLQDDKKFKLAAMRLCNEVAALFQVGQVSIGWDRGDKKQIEVVAISNIEAIDQRTNAVWELEAAMEECLDRDEEILWNHENTSNDLMRAHKAYGEVRSVGYLISLPIRLGDKVVGVLTCEDTKRAFTEEDAWKLRLLLEQCSRHMALLEERDQWVGARLRRRTKAFAATFMSVEKLGYKLVGIGILIVAAILAFGQWSYRVDGTFLLKAQNMVHLSSPIDGVIDDAPFRPGDQVSKDDVLLSLNTRELLLEQAKTFAQIARHKHEIEKFRASYALADMRIAQAAMDAASAGLKQIEYRLENTVIKAPFDGVVVEGDLQTKIGAPLRTGETFMRVASLDNLYVEIMIPEKDIHEITIDKEGEIVFVGRPDIAYRIRLDQLVPQAEAQGGQNVFIVKAQMLDAQAPWWRPGMSGVSKVDVGKRPIWWILTHETLDYLRLHFWF